MMSRPSIDVNQGHKLLIVMLITTRLVVVANISLANVFSAIQVQDYHSLEGLLWPTSLPHYEP